MKVTTLTTEGKEGLRKAIRGLREPLIQMLTDAAKSEYRLDVAIDKAKLPEARHCRRKRLEACLDEEARSAARVANGSAESNVAPSAEKTPKASKKSKRGAKPATPGSGSDRDAGARTFQKAVKEAAHTLVNRLVLLRILEHHGLLSPAVITGGWKGEAYSNEFVHYAGPLGTDDTRGYRALLEVVYAELAIELPGLFGPVGLTSFFPVPAQALHAVVDTLNDNALDSAWGDDTTLGWVYQYWNDPEREALDKKIADGGKIEPHEIASKTQMFTERYMAEWLLHNSLGFTWLSICKRNRWKAHAEAIFPVLDARRAEWRHKRNAGEVALDALMPIADGLESRWKYWVTQPIPEDAIEKAQSSIRDVKLLDPACGSGHFLVIAFGLFAALYEEEAQHRGISITRAEVAESILANNLHGVDIDPRATQIAAAGLWLQAKLHARDAKLAKMNLVAPTFRLAGLAKDDPSLLRLYTELGTLGVARATAEKMVEGLAGVDYLGTLLRVDKAIRALVDDTAKEDGELFAHGVEKRRAELESKVGTLLDAHASESDLGLRLEGEQLAAGLRFLDIVKEGRYDVVAGNPPYQGITKTSRFEYVVRNYARGKADLYAAFMERGLELTREGGISALVTMRGWMFLSQFRELRHSLLHESSILRLADLGTGAFSSRSMDDVISTVLVVSLRASSATLGTALQAGPLGDPRRDAGKPIRRHAALLSHDAQVEFDPKAFAVILDEPIVYTWTKDFLAKYARAPKLGEAAAARKGLCTGDDVRFIRYCWEVSIASVLRVPIDLQRPSERDLPEALWHPSIFGGKGAEWLHPARTVIPWRANGLLFSIFSEVSNGVRVQNAPYYFRPGVAFSAIGSSFSARLHRLLSVFGDKGPSVFPADPAEVVCTLNRTETRRLLQSLNPTISFQVGDINRVPLIPVSNSKDIVRRLVDSFDQSEAGSESSMAFLRPQKSCWQYTQGWAQGAVDRPEGAPLPPYEPEYKPPDPAAVVSFAVGVALGRFGANGEGILDAAPATALPAGILFVAASDDLTDSLAHPAAQPMLAAWEEHRASILAEGKQLSFREWLRGDKGFFAYHKGVYENRPIYFPLSSEKRSFVAWVSIHRWTDATLRTLIADHLNPVLRQLDAEIADLNASRASSDKKIAAAADRQYNSVKRLRDEIFEFIALVSQCAERGAPPADGSDPRTWRKADATFHMHLDDGVMINSAALWPLLSPIWADPKKWWKQLCLAEGKKDYDWSQVARRYFPDRVGEKCKEDPSLAVAHGCFWKYHPAKAYAWELRLQDEIRPDFTFDEDGSNDFRGAFLAAHAAEAAAIRAKELQRQERNAAKEAGNGDSGGPTSDEDESADNDAEADT